jgi:hypothetical protein
MLKKIYPLTLHNIYRYPLASTTQPKLRKIAHFSRTFMVNILIVNSLFKLSLHSLVTAISHISALYYLSIRDKECVICRAT